ncbi:hypothetical protein BHE74_00028603 [Ensete ventricosum]|nr:hypothetical protein BHE74_00028603 [Ensete ventricosum]RZR82937.1 hypothetical protein BHM03_00009460 [Ensete ventricosum]
MHCVYGPDTSTVPVPTKYRYIGADWGNSSILSSGFSSTVQMPPQASSPHVSKTSSNMEVMPMANKSIIEKKASVYAEILRNLNDARGRGLHFKSAMAFRDAYGSMGLDFSGMRSVTMQKIWHLIQVCLCCYLVERVLPALVAEYSNNQQKFSRKMSLVIGARRHLEWGHEKYILDMIKAHPSQV